MVTISRFVNIIVFDGTSLAGRLGCKFSFMGVCSFSYTCLNFSDSLVVVEIVHFERAAVGCIVLLLSALTASTLEWTKRPSKEASLYIVTWMRSFTD